MNPPLVLAAVSGGADSLALLYFLRESGARLIVAHYNHQLRPDADEDEAFVREIAAALGLPFVCDSRDVAVFAEQNRLSLEEAARQLRYRFLFRAARQAGAESIATGHTADDQAETVLMHFLRGAALPGLTGMSARTLLPAFDPEIPLWRPLLGWTRAQTEAFCRARGLAYRIDSSNSDSAYLRNRLRHELLPLLEAYNPKIRQALAKTTQVLQEDAELLREMEDAAWQQAAVRAGSGFVQFDRLQLSRLSPALRRRLLRRAAFTLQPFLRDVDFEALQRAASLQPAHLAGGLRTFREGDWLYLAQDESALPRDLPQIDAPLTLSVGQIYDLGGGWFLTSSLETVAGFPPAFSQADSFSAALDADLTGSNFQLRLPQRGERFQPLGMSGGALKLSDFFINLKIPRRLRRYWPLLCAGDEIAWVAGLRLAHRFRVTEKTRRVVKFSLKKM
ncbi:MAG: tRNA lysidine(34) synthetase TilS [Anaerolineales bacterium]